MKSSHAVFNAAAAAHRANRIYCQAIGDESQHEWEDCPEWQADSAIMGAQAIADNPDLTPEQSHAGWMAQKAAEGWTFGEAKDAEKKTHPCMVPYDELPIQQRVKDEIFRAVVSGVLAHEQE
jgi:hypothetical protein